MTILKNVVRQRVIKDLAIGCDTACPLLTDEFIHDFSIKEAV